VRDEHPEIMAAVRDVARATDLMDAHLSATEIAISQLLAQANG